MSIKSEKAILDLTINEVAKLATETIQRELDQSSPCIYAAKMMDIIDRAVRPYLPQKMMKQKGLRCDVRVDIGTSVVREVILCWTLRKGHPFYSDLFPNKDLSHCRPLFRVRYSREVVNSSAEYRFKNLVAADIDYGKTHSIADIIELDVSLHLNDMERYKNAARTILENCAGLTDIQLNQIVRAVKTLTYGHLPSLIHRDGKFLSVDWGDKAFLQEMAGFDSHGQRVLSCSSEGRHVLPAGVTEERLKNYGYGMKAQNRKEISE